MRSSPRGPSDESLGYCQACLRHAPGHSHTIRATGRTPRSKHEAWRRCAWPCPPCHPRPEGADDPSQGAQAPGPGSQRSRSPSPGGAAEGAPGGRATKPLLKEQWHTRGHQRHPNPEPRRSRRAFLPSRARQEAVIDPRPLLALRRPHHVRHWRTSRQWQPCASRSARSPP